MIIAIDGPAGSGKSTVAKLVATALGFHYLDTGAMYRAIAFRALEAGVPLDDERMVTTIANAETVSFEHEDGSVLPTRVFLSGQDVTAQIREPRVDDAVSPVARIAGVRAAMVVQQRQAANESDTVVEGRDIGTVVFPDAEVKVFLTASAEERARRRSDQHAEQGIVSDEAAVHEAILRRDRIDSTRAVAPLAVADDAVTIDTTGLSIDEVVARIVGLAGRS